MAGIIDLFVLLVALIILWAIVSLPVYIAAKVVTSGRPRKATFGQAMWATLGGAIVYVIVLVGVAFFLGAVIGHTAAIFAVLLAFLAWLAFYRSVFEVGWLGAFGIAVLAVIVIFVMNVVLVALFGVHLPTSFHPF